MAQESKRHSFLENFETTQHSKPMTEEKIQEKEEK